MDAWAFRTLIVPTAQVQLARDIAATLSPTAGQNMWITGLSATGNVPVTHYVSTGLIAPEFAALVPEQVWEQDPDTGAWTETSSTPGDPVACYRLCVAGSFAVTQAQVNAVYAAADVTAQEPFTAMRRKGLHLVQAPI